MNLWRAGCVETRTSGSEGGPRKRTGRKPGTALRPDPYYQHTGDRQALKRRVRLLQRQLKPVLREHAGKKIRYRQGRRFARGLLKLWPALWTFANHPAVQPTNNHAERALRGAVIYRKLSLGSQSEHGEQRIARLLSAHTTCRLQHRSLHAYLIDVLTARAAGQPAPLLT